jgi:TPR repeat protein
METHLRNYILIPALIIAIVAKWTDSSKKKEEEDIKQLPYLVELGDPEAQYQLGVRYEEGDRYTKTDRIAYAFFKLAAPRHADASKRLDALQARLPAYLIEAGDELAKKMEAEKSEQVRLARMSDVFQESERYSREWRELTSERNGKKEQK